MPAYTCFESIEVYDPSQGLDGHRLDLWIRDDRIFAYCKPGELPENIQTFSEAELSQVERIAGNTRFALALAVDMHTHLISPVSSAWTSGPVLEYQFHDEVIAAYQALGYGYLLEAAVPTGLASQAQREVARVQMARSNLNIGFLLSILQDEPIRAGLPRWTDKQCVAHFEKLIERTGAYGLKLVNPDQQLLPEMPDVVDRMLDVNGALALPHALHVHAPNLGEAGAIESIRKLLAITKGRQLHLAHLQYYTYGGKDDSAGFDGQQFAVEEMLALLEAYPHVTADLGLVDFGPCLLLSEDFPLMEKLGRLIEQPAGSVKAPMASQDVSYFRTLAFHRSPVIEAHAMQWLTGLALALKSNNTNQLALTMDHPNGGGLACYANLISQLMDQKRREAVLALCPEQVQKAAGIMRLNEVLTAYDLAVLSRSAPAKILGPKVEALMNLKVNQVANIVFYQRQDDLMKMWQNPWGVMHQGQWFKKPVY